MSLAFPRLAILLGLHLPLHLNDAFLDSLNLELQEPRLAMPCEAGARVAVDHVRPWQRSTEGLRARGDGSPCAVCRRWGGRVHRW